MKLLWLCNMVPGAVRECLGGNSDGGLWVDHVLADIRSMEEIDLHICCRDDREGEGRVDDRLSYFLFRQPIPQQYSTALEKKFESELLAFQPDVIHIWGTEYAHTLAMVNAAEKAGMAERVIIGIQGLCTYIARHYAEGVPYTVQKHFTLRDLLRQDNILQQQKKFGARGALEAEALGKVSHVLGRTQWDAACTAALNPGRQYHFCNETLRAPFYDGRWQYAACRKHTVLAPNCYYPVKGFHYLLEAFAEVRKMYPDAVLSVPGSSFLSSGWKAAVKQDGYRKYLSALVRQYELTDHIRFLGHLNAVQMREAFLSTHVFALPSTIENSSNSLGEAMLLGVPCVASDVGGTASMLKTEEEGILYQSTAPYMLAAQICRVFAMEDAAEQMGGNAAARARRTHDPEKNLEDLLAAYNCVMGGIH